MEKIHLEKDSTILLMTYIKKHKGQFTNVIENLHYLETEGLYKIIGFYSYFNIVNRCEIRNEHVLLMHNSTEKIFKISASKFYDSLYCNYRTWMQLQNDEKDLNGLDCNVKILPEKTIIRDGIKRSVPQYYIELLV